MQKTLSFMFVFVCDAENPYIVCENPGIEVKHIVLDVNNNADNLVLR